MRTGARVASGLRGASVGVRDCRELSRDSPLENAPFPPICTVAMQQDGGGSAECVVEVGDLVAEGMLLGRASGELAANVHSPVPGRVAAITDIRLATGDWSTAVVVELEGRFARSGKPPKAYDWRKMSRETILDRIRSNGVVGLGGESFPLRVVWGAPGTPRPETLVANGIDSEPYLTACHRLLVEKAAQVVAGLRIAEKILEPHRVVIAVEEGRPEVLEVVTGAVRRFGLGYEVMPLDASYPHGQARYLLENVTGRDLPYPGIPEDIGCVLASVETLNAIYEAVVHDQPLLERVVTVSGVVRYPANLKARIGTSIRDLVEECGGFTEPPSAVVAGGPMTGFTLDELDIPVTKDVSGVVALSRRSGRLPRSTPCVSCGECIRVCPAGLNPVLLHKQITHGWYEEADSYGLAQCSECGCCAYVCPAGIRLAESMRRGKLGSASRRAAH